MQVSARRQQLPDCLLDMSSALIAAHRWTQPHRMSSLRAAAEAISTAASGLE